MRDSGEKGAGMRDQDPPPPLPDPALRVAEAMIGAKVINIAFRQALFLEFGARTRPQDLWPFLLSETE